MSSILSWILWLRQILTMVAAIYTSDVSRALRIAGLIEAGNVSINAIQFPGHITPFGGWKESGSGSELGKYGFKSYLKTKTISIK